MLDKPAGGAGFVTVKDGRLFEGSKRFRIFGVNIAFGGNFPTHADAEKVAARMAKFGINCVRFHHMDMKAAPDGIWSADMATLDPGQLDKLDYFIAQLKKNGIYADLNLHVSRSYPGMPRWAGMADFFKGVDNFYPPLIAMQRDYARRLLTHVNPYTGTAYIDEPAVALIEINNENGLINEWSNGSLDNMPDPCRAEFQGSWNGWLQAKYRTRDALAAAWNAGQEPLGAEMFRNGAFQNAAAAPWILEQHESARAAAVGDDGALRIHVSRIDGVAWHVQLTQAGIAFSGSSYYTLTFRARGDAPRRITLVASQNHAPWNQLWSANVELTSDWRAFHFIFQPSADESDGRIVFSGLGDAAGNYWLADASLRAGGVAGLQSGERLGGVPIFMKSETRSGQAQRDWMAFLYDTESRYWTGMEQFLKVNLKAHSLIVGTATGFSPASIQAKLDVVDGHAYWQHPRFPDKMWDPADWNVNNVPMAGVSDGGTIPGLAGRRVAGKPYICTEYNEPRPNTHASEAFLLLNAYAAFQDLDGVFVFAYSHRHDDWDTRHVTSFFDVDQDPGKMVTFPAAVSMFLRGDVAAAGRVVTYPVPWEAAIDMSMRVGSWWGMEAFGMARTQPLQARVQMDVVDRVDEVDKSEPAELNWDTQKGCVTVNTPRSKAFIGNITGGPVSLGDVTIEPYPNMQNWAAITLTEMGAHDFLITATGYWENTGMRWTSPAKDSVGRDWGGAPSLAEGIPAKITLPAGAGNVEAWALDGRGQRMSPVKVARAGREAAIEIGPQYQTLWYELRTP